MFKLEKYTYNGIYLILGKWIKGFKKIENTFIFFFEDKQYI